MKAGHFVDQWPGGAHVAVSLTFDVDAESGWIGDGTEYQGRLSTLSDARFGVVRGLGRILKLLDEFGISATFYVPGDTAIRHTQAVKDIVSAGHEIGHHGHLHLMSHTIDADTQRREIVDGLAALSEHLDVTPIGYRSPAWELTPQTFELLLEHEFQYDSSCMGDDRPYLERLGSRTLLELPVQWSLDDWPLLAWHPSADGILSPPSAVKEIWLAEFDAAVTERRHVTYTMHPEVIGRGHRMAMLRQLIIDMQRRGPVWFASHGDVCAFLGQTSVKLN